LVCFVTGINEVQIIGMTTSCNEITVEEDHRLDSDDLSGTAGTENQKVTAEKQLSATTGESAEGNDSVCRNTTEAAGSIPRTKDLGVHNPETEAEEANLESVGIENVSPHSKNAADLISVATSESVSVHGSCPTEMGAPKSKDLMQGGNIGSADIGDSSESEKLQKMADVLSSDRAVTVEDVDAHSQHDTEWIKSGKKAESNSLPEVGDLHSADNYICNQNVSKVNNAASGMTQEVHPETTLELAALNAAKPCLHDVSSRISPSTDISGNTRQTMFGTPVSDLSANLSTRKLPKLCDSMGKSISFMHTVLIDIDVFEVDPKQVPEPFPSTCKPDYDKWDDFHVRMPCSPKYETSNIGQWELIRESLKEEFLTSIDVVDAIQRYSTWYYADFTGLHLYFVQKEPFDKTLLRFIADLALDLPNICTRPIPLLRKQKDASVMMSQKQAACLLANAFFCTFPKMDSYTFLPLTFGRLYRESSAQEVMFAKLECIFNYFRRVRAEMPCGNITFHRQVRK
jgi:hypothetical protein